MKFLTFYAVLLPAMMLSADDVLPQGGSFAWTSLQAEAAATNAEVLMPTRKAGNFAAECVGRSGVKLNQTGDYIEFVMPKEVNALVIRHAIPDAPAGNGEEHTLNLYVDGKLSAKIPVTSRHSWLYGKENDPGNDPAELTRLPGSVARRFFDDARVLLPQSIPAGSKVKLQKDADNLARYYAIDLIDAELAPPPVAQPENSLSAKDFGAVGDGKKDDSEAIQTWLAAAEKQQKTAYLPPGVYRTSRRFEVNEITIQGAGMWYSMILNRRYDLNNKSNGVGFQILKRSTLRDFSIHGDGIRRTDESHALRGNYGDGSILENLWIEQAESGAWIGRDNQPAAQNLLVKNCRFRNLLADGINLCAGTQNAVVVNCHVRGAGDDSFAVWAAPKGRLASSNNTIRNCTAEAPWRARCFAIFGGDNNKVLDCIGRDTLTSGGLTATTEFDAYPFGGTTVFRNIKLERCGGWFWNNLPYGDIVLRADGRDYMAPIVFDNIQSSDGANAAITVIWGKNKVQNITVKNSTFTNNGKCAVEIFRDANGMLELDNVRFVNAPSPLLINQSPETFTVTGLESPNATEKGK